MKAASVKKAVAAKATVLTADAPFVAAVDIRGGAPGSRETDLLAPGRLVSEVDALGFGTGLALGLLLAQLTIPLPGGEPVHDHFWIEAQGNVNLF